MLNEGEKTIIKLDLEKAVEAVKKSITKAYEEFGINVDNIELAGMELVFVADLQIENEEIKSLTRMKIYRDDIDIEEYLEDDNGDD